MVNFSPSAHSRKTKARIIFENFDKNNDGTICRDELQLALQQFNLKHQADMVDIFMEQVDKDGDDKISYSEFKHFCRKFEESSGNSSPTSSAPLAKARSSFRPSTAPTKLKFERRRKVLDHDWEEIKRQQKHLLTLSTNPSVHEHFKKESNAEIKKKSLVWVRPRSLDAWQRNYDEWKNASVDEDWRPRKPCPVLRKEVREELGFTRNSPRKVKKKIKLQVGLREFEIEERDRLKGELNGGGRRAREKTGVEESRDDNDEDYYLDEQFEELSEPPQQPSSPNKAEIFDEVTKAMFNFVKLEHSSNTSRNKALYYRRLSVACKKLEAAFPSPPPTYTDSKSDTKRWNLPQNVLKPVAVASEAATTKEKAAATNDDDGYRPPMYFSKNSSSISIDQLKKEARLLTKPPNTKANSDSTMHWRESATTTKLVGNKNKKKSKSVTIDGATKNHYKISLYKYSRSAEECQKVLEQLASVLSSLKACSFFTLEIDLRSNELRMGVVAANTLEAILSSPAVISLDLRENAGTNQQGELVRGHEFLETYPNLKACILNRVKIFHTRVEARLRMVAVGNSNLVKTVTKKSKMKSWQVDQNNKEKEKMIYINSTEKDANAIPSFEEIVRLTKELDRDGDEDENGDGDGDDEEVRAHSTIQVNKNYLLRSGFRSYSP